MNNVKSNISIYSNIYIVKKNDCYTDISYLRNVTGKKLLREIQRKTNYSLTSWQDKISNLFCVDDKNGEQTYGIVLDNGEYKISCRCENNSCHRYEECMRGIHKTINREGIRQITVESETEPYRLNYEHLGISADVIDSIDKEELFEYEEQEDIENKEITEQFKEETNPDVSQEIPASEIKFSEIDNSQCIIEGDINSHILVNAGPGTGKTYTAIQRILYLLQNNLVSSDEILVLCYTRAAKQVIKSRIDDKIKDGTLPPNAGNVNIYTFDSMATHYLILNEVEFEALDYNERIEKFNKIFDPEDFDIFKYIIIDEVQDLVNQRALMVLNIMGSVDCGWLLLGDKCQAIYDYDCDDSTEKIDSVEFYKRMEKILPADTNKYELTGNRRQGRDLAEYSDSIRSILLNKNIELHNELVQLRLTDIEETKYGINRFEPILESGKTTAILCRTNGEAEIISARFHQKGIDHTLYRGLGQLPMLNRWIADVFWDFCDSEMAHKEFIQRYCLRINDNTEEAEKHYKALLELCEENQEKLELSLFKIRQKLRNRADLSELFITKHYRELVISTIHRSKGNEFDIVYLLTQDLNGAHDSSEEARVRYVGVTRARNNLFRLKRVTSHYVGSKRLQSGRGMVSQYHYKNTHCSNVVLGLNDDIVPQSFVSGDIENAILNQEYIAKKIKKNDNVIVEFDSKKKKYIVKHYSDDFGYTNIGYLSGSAVSDIRDAINQTTYRNNMPTYLTDLYISDVITYIPNDSNVPIEAIFGISKIWLGVEITGVAKLHFIN